MVLYSLSGQELCRNHAEKLKCAKCLLINQLALFLSLSFSLSISLSPTTLNVPGEAVCEEASVQ